MSISISSRSHRFSTSVVQEDKGHKIFEGYISKSGKINTKYQTRWFVLYSNNTLAYYSDSTATYEAPLGEINLYTVLKLKENDNNHNIFHLITPKRTYDLKCNENDALDQWIKKIKLRVSPNIICKGWLYKKGEKIKSWKLRYFLLCEYELHYEVRYYENEKMTKYKGKINCDYIDDIKILPNTSIQKYGKDKVIQLITQTRTYVIAAKDTKSRNLWYKSFKKVLFGEEIEKKNKKVEKEKYEQQKMEEAINNAKLFDSLSSSMQKMETKTETKSEKEKIIKQHSIFVEKRIEPKMEQKTEPKPLTPFRNEEINEFEIKQQTINTINTINKYKQSYEPFVEKQSYKQNINSIDDEKEIEIEIEMDDNAPVFGSNGIIHNETYINDSITIDSNNNTNPFFVEQNQSMQTENRIDLMSNSLGTVSTVNAINDGSNGHEPLPPNDNDINNSNTNYIQDSMLSNNSISQTNNENNNIKTQSIVYSDKFLETDYEAPTYGLLENDIQIVENAHDPHSHKCCSKCVVL